MPGDSSKQKSALPNSTQIEGQRGGESRILKEVRLCSPNQVDPLPN